MSLEGTLQERPLTSTLQMLGARSASGRLTVTRGTSAHERLIISFRNGLIVSTESRLRRPDLRIGELIRRGEYVSEAHIGNAIAQAERGGGHVGDILVAEKKLDGIVLGELLQLQMAEDLFDAVRWSEGAYRFEEGPSGRPSPAPPITPKEFLAGCLKHLSRWDEIEAVIPDRALAFRKKSEGPIPDQEIVRHRLTQEDLRIYTLVHSSRSVSSLLPLARLPVYQLYASLFLLHKANLIELAPQGAFVEAPASTPEPDANAFTQVRVKREGGRSMRESLVYHGVTALLLVVVLSLVVGTYLSRRPDAVNANGAVAQAAPIDPLREPRTAAQQERIRLAVEAWHARRGELPPRLEALVEARLLEPRDLSWPDYERSYVLLPEGEGFLIIRPKK